jgi:GT2 family glycosyltransferase
VTDIHDTAATAAADSGAPPVVAVVVTCNPGSWFEETLRALRNQDYPNLAVLVIDAASTDDPLPRVAAELPSAYVRRLSRNPGYAAAANRALRIVQGASHLVFCHDDVAPEPEAVRKMMEVAFRYNAGIVAPKQVSWSDTGTLVSMGGTVDRTGASVPLVESGDFDQGQHDTSREIFVAAGGSLLIRADLFESLGGFDGAMTLYGEDVDISWRAQLLGARIVTAPEAVVRHLEATTKGMRLMVPPTSDESDRDADQIGATDELILQRRHRLRTLLKVRRGLALPLVIAQLGLISIVEVLYAIATNRHSHASAVSASWSWNFAHLRGLFKARRRLRRARTVPDSAIKPKLGSMRDRLEGIVRREWEIRREKLHNEGFSGRDVVGMVRNLTAAVVVCIVALWLLGSRELLGGAPLPTVGQFVPLAETPMDALRTYFGVYPEETFGAPVPTSPSNLVVGLLGIVLFGSMTLALKVLVLAMLPIGIFGVIRLTRPLSSTRARLVAALAYAAVPVPYEAISLGRLDVLVAYAAAPWILHRLLRTHGISPYLNRRASDTIAFNFKNDRPGDDDTGLGTLVFNDSADAVGASGLTAAAQLRDSFNQQEPKSKRNAMKWRDKVLFVLLRRVLPLALLLATAGVFVPQILVVTIAAALSLTLGSFLAGSLASETPARGQTLLVAVLGSALALALLTPGLGSSASGLAAAWDSPAVSSSVAFLEYLYLDSMSGVSYLTVGLLIAGLPGLLIGRDWRFRLSVKLWSIVVGLAVFSWSSSQGWIVDFNPDPMVVLSLAGAAVALNAAVGIHALGTDLRAYKFGWRQLVPIVAVAGVVVSLVPVAQLAGNGSWGLPSLSTTQLLSWMDAGDDEASYRVLWLGDSNALPGTARIFDEDLSAAVAVNRPAPTGPGEPISGGRAEDGLARAVTQARERNTVSLGGLLAPYGVRYIVVPNATGTVDGGGQSFPPPPDVVPAFNSQLDLVSVETDRSLAVYENTSWLPMRASLSPEATLAARTDITADGRDALITFDTSESEPVLRRGDERSGYGRVEEGEVFLGERGGRTWSLEVNGVEVPQQDAFGWASAFAVPEAGEGVLRYSPPPFIPAIQVLVISGWLLVAFLSFKFRAKRGRYT